MYYDPVLKVYVDNNSLLVEQQRKELGELNRILLPMYHHAAHSYNKWTLRRDKNNTINYSEALDKLREYGKKQFK